MPKAVVPRSRGVRGRLETAQRTQSLVRIFRTIRHSDTIDGFVVGVGQAWVLVAALDTRIHLDGYVALRIDDVWRVRARGGPDTFVGRALAARGEWPPVGADVELDDIARLVATAAEVTPLVTLHIEEKDPDVCFIGRPVRITRKAVHLAEIDPRAEWREKPTKWRFTDITRVDFAGGYEEALALVGGVPSA